MKIGLLSDTHGYLDERIFEYFKDVDEVWHAGDVGNVALLEQLSAFKSLKCVYGNIDGQEIRLQSSEYVSLNFSGYKVVMIHIGGAPYKYTARAKELIAKYKPQLFICGHSHTLRVVTDKSLGNMLYMNPGAAGRSGFHHTRTILRFEISNQKIMNLQAIELGPRAQKKQD